jgi:hypothetical protein
VCTSTFSKLCKNMYTVPCRRVFSSAPLQLTGSRPLVAFGNETYELNLKKLELQIRQLHYESGRQVIVQVSSQSPVVWLLNVVHY